MYFGIIREYKGLDVLIRAAQLLKEKLEDFKSRNVEVIACSTDSEQSHWGWLELPKEKGGIKGVNYPILADLDKTISMNYDVLFGDYKPTGKLSFAWPKSMDQIPLDYNNESLNN